jgi:hypothetical protein
MRHRTKKCRRAAFGNPFFISRCQKQRALIAAHRISVRVAGGYETRRA